MVVVALLVCLRLGLWQLHRTESGGTVQNLGYTVLWPIFGLAFVYMWFRFLQLEVLKDAEDDAELTAMAAGDLPGTLDGPGRMSGDCAAAPVDPEPAPGPGTPTLVTPQRARTDLTPADVPSTTIPVRTGNPGTTGNPRSIEAGTDAAAEPGSGAVAAVTPVSPRSPSRGITVAVSTVGDDDDDPELAAYNRALADLAEKDHRRAR